MRIYYAIYYTGKIWAAGFLGLSMIKNNFALLCLQAFKQIDSEKLASIFKL